MLEKTAYLLVYHGSRDSRPQQEVERLAQEVREKLGNLSVSSQKREATTVLTKFPSSLVETAPLELGEISLEDAIAQWGEQVTHQGLTDLKIIPLFLLPGVHVREDIPQAVSQAQQQVKPFLSLSLTQHLGASPLMAQQLQEQLKGDSSAKIILSHGSRRSGGNQPIEKLAAQLGATAAYWSVSPSLTEQVERLAQLGKSSFSIVPYFLFPGGITDAIAQQVQFLQHQFPEISIRLGSPLCYCLSLSTLIVNEIVYERSKTSW